MNVEQAKELKRLGPKMLDPEVWAEVQRLTDPNAGFGAKVLGGKVPLAENILMRDGADGRMEVHRAEELEPQPVKRKGR